MTESIEIRSFTLEDELLRTMDSRKRNQLLGCMHAHNELTFLNRLRLFSYNSVSDGELHGYAQTSQSWCVHQLLAGKLHETWDMLAKRFSLAKKKAQQDAVVTALCPEHQASLVWLQGYFSGKGAKDRAIPLVRNKTAFHYEGLDMDEAVKNLAHGETTFHIAQHPVNALYWVGSAVVFRTILAKIADAASPTAKGRDHSERVGEGFHMLEDDVEEANFHLHLVLYGLIKGLIEDALGHSLGSGRATNIEGAPTPEGVALCPWLKMTPRGRSDLS
jgi:hypothetical protein